MSLLRRHYLIYPATTALGWGEGLDGGGAVGGEAVTGGVLTYRGQTALRVCYASSRKIMRTL